MSKMALEAKDRGNAAYKNGDYAAAHACYDEAIRLSPQETVFYSNKSAVFFEEGRFDDCIATCKKALNVGSENENLVAEVIYRLAKAKSAQGKTAEALTWLEMTSAEQRNAEIVKLMADLRLEAQHRFLSFTYASELFSSLMEIEDDDKASAAIRNAVFSSSTMSAHFVKFLQGFTVFSRDGEPGFFEFMTGNGFFNVCTAAVYVKKEAAFSWIAPFIVHLAICDDQPNSIPTNLAYNLLPRTSSVLQTFYLRLPEENIYSLHCAVKPFIRRQLPNLQMIHCPIEFLFELSPNPAEPKAFAFTSLVVREFADLTKLFKTKRFTTSSLELVFLPATSSNFNLVRSLTTFLKTLKIRLPETQSATLELPVRNVRFRAADLVRALYTVFPQLQVLDLNVTFSLPEKIIFFDRDRLVKNYVFLSREAEKMPTSLRVFLDIEESVKCGNHDIYHDLTVTPPLGFAVTDATTQSRYNPFSFGIVNVNAGIPISHDNKCLRYDVFFG